jgi:hypothetical protein
MAKDEQSPLTEDQQSGTPVAMMSEQDAITRKVPEAEIIASMDTFRDVPKQSTHARILLPAVGVAVVALVVIVALAMQGKRTPAPAPVSGVGAQVASPEASLQQQPFAAPSAPNAAASPRIKPVSEIIRLGIAAEPMETELSLDGNVLAGHRLNLEVPKDRGIHVVSASAPGYIPFNQQVSFTSDVVLKISLHRAHTPPVRQAAKSRPTQVESSPKSNVRGAAVSAGPVLTPGMSLQGPAVRPNAKPIDERNPYKP